MRLSVLPPSILLYVFISVNPVRSVVSLDFSAYPAAAQSCLEDAAGISGCQEDTVTEENQCLCSNTGGFVTNTASCVANQGDAVLIQVWQLLQQSCSDTKTPLEVSEADFFAVEATKVTTTITATSAGVLTTFLSTSTMPIAATATATDSASATSEDDDDDDDGHDDMATSAKIGAITASISGTLAIVCIVCLVVLLRKRKKDKALLKQVQDAARDGDRSRGPDKPLLNQGDVTPGFTSPGGHGSAFGASVVPPTPSYRGPMSPENRRRSPEPTELANNQRGLEPSELESHNDCVTGHLGQWPSPVSQGGGTVGSWCPSPLSAMPSRQSTVSAVPPSTVLGMYNNDGSGTINTLSTIGESVVGSPVSRQLTGSTVSRSSWAHNRPQQELYELPGTEVRSPIGADPQPLSRSPKRNSVAITPAPPPEYSAGDWNDPITDKPPTWV